jgi:transcriptional regulator with XRE-family HTH domain
MKIGIAVRKLRELKGLTQTDLAEKCGLSQNTICQIEKNNKMPHLSNLDKISEVLGTSPAIILFYGIEEEDIAENKRESYKILAPSLKALIESII